MQEQMSNVNRNRNSKKEKQRDSGDVTEMRIAFDELISRLDTAKERISARGHVSRILKNLKEKKTKNGEKKEWNIQRLCNNYERCNIQIMEILEKKEQINI